MLICRYSSVTSFFSQEGKEKPFPLIVCVQTLLIYATDDLWLPVLCIAPASSQEGSLASTYITVQLPKAKAGTYPNFGDSAIQVVEKDELGTFQVVLCSRAKQKNN